MSLFDDGHQSDAAVEDTKSEKPLNGTLLHLPKKEVLLQPDLVKPTMSDILAVRSGEL